MPGLMEMLFGSPDEMQQVSTLNPQQQQSLSQLLSQLGMMGGQGGSYSGAHDYLSSLLSGDQNAFSQFEAPYRAEFEQQTIPRLAERFAGLNPMGGGLGSSGFAQALGGAGAGLSAQLAGLHGNLRQNASQQAMGQYNNLAGLGLGTKSFENFFRPGDYGLAGQAAQGLGAGAGMAMGGGMPGAMAGGMGFLKSLFGGR